MDNPTQNSIEKQLAQAGRDFIYPPTPDIAVRVAQQTYHPGRRQVGRRRSAAWAAGLLILMLAILLAVPPVRAQILEFLQFGAIRIFLSTPTPTPTLAPTQTIIPGTLTPAPTLAPTQTVIPGTLTPAPSLTPSPLPSLLDLGGETTLTQAQQQTNFTILLPTYPADLGPPDKVYFQDSGGPTVILVWLQAGNPAQVRMSLMEFGPGSLANKYFSDKITSTTVNGKNALWLQGNHALFLQKRNASAGNIELMVNANVLLWTEGDITYRLESSLPLDEARRVAESLKPAGNL
jgi:hypothetical protein